MESAGAKRKHSHITGSEASPALRTQPKEATEGSEKGKLSTKAIERSKTVADKCRELDGDRCIVTGYTHPEICHIVPFAWNNSDYNVSKTEKFIPIISDFLDLPVDSDSTRALASLYAERGSSDKVWNIVALNSIQHFWWDPEKHLSSQLNHSYGSKPTICDKDNCETCQGTSGVTAHNAHSGRPIRTGDIFTVVRDTNDVNFFHRMIDIQWAIICAAAISGAALAPELLGDLEDKLFLSDYGDEAEVSDEALSEEGEGQLALRSIENQPQPLADEKSTRPLASKTTSPTKSKTSVRATKATGVATKSENINPTFHP
ncbi:hypothetical protein EDB80DRAFT_869796 [Ilyonectria destructans]|nr:hypothetical protein EDB80DRAFT_869796 [Ilyonectria destructans]